MKKVTFFIILAIASFSCSKDTNENLRQNNSSNKHDLSEGVSLSCDVCNQAKADVTIHDGVLKLNSITHYLTLRRCLEQDIEAYCQSVDYFIDPNWNEEQIELYLTSINYDEQKPLKDFYKWFNGYQPLLLKMNDLIKAWEETADFNLDTHPERKIPIITEIEQTLINKEGKIIFGDSLVEYANLWPTSSCFSYALKNSSLQINSTTRVYGSVAIMPNPFGTMVASVTKGYKYKNGKWENTRMKITNQYAGALFEMICGDTPYYFTMFTITKNKKKINRLDIPYWFKRYVTKDEKISSIHSIADFPNQTLQVYLTEGF
jgi:hypothetical protein